MVPGPRPEGGKKVVELLTQLEKCLSNLADMETQNFRQLHRMSKILFVLTMASCAVAVTGLALVVLRLCG